MTMFMGYRVIMSDALTKSVEDWSGCRSPSRAMRRRRQGHPQHVVTRQVPSREVLVTGDVMLVHPAMWHEVRTRLKSEMYLQLYGGRTGDRELPLTLHEVDYAAVEARLLAQAPTFSSAARFAKQAFERMMKK